MFWIIGGAPLVLAALALVFDPMPEWLGQQFRHADWEGFRALDLVMPLFLFVVGLVMPFSLAKRRDSLAGVYSKIIRRTIILFVLGIVVQGNLLAFNLSSLHIYCNTLQAIAVGYFVAAIVMLNVPVLGQLAITVALLVGFWAVMMLVPIPGHGAGLLDPEMNFARYVDEMILGRFRPDDTYTWIVSSMTFSASVLLGVMGGHILKTSWRDWIKLLALTMAGVGCLVAGWVWSYWFPIIKHLWTSSMTLWAAGWSFLLLALFYAVIDVVGWRKWAFPLVVIGANAIFVYTATQMFNFHQIGDVFVGGLTQHVGQYAELVRHTAALAVIWLILLYMYRKGTFIRV